MDKLNNGQIENLLSILKNRFESNIIRHGGASWDKLIVKLQTSPEKIASLFEMERTGGEPDVVGYDENTDEYLFFDCSPESPKGRRNICYDRAALESRKEFKPQASALGIAEEMGIKILTEEQYRYLQQLGKFDLKTSSWIETPEKIRKLGGALYCDRRYDTVFVYHNGAESYYGVRGFRGALKV